jgi:hypothetical protein
MQKPNDAEVVWVEYPEGRRFRARYEAAADVFVVDGRKLDAADVANWSREEHEDYDISDDPKQELSGRLARDQ